MRDCISQEQYRVVLSFRGVNGEKRFVEIPNGAVLRIMGYPEREDLVSIEWEGQQLLVFIQDLEHRSVCERTLQQQYVA